MRSPRLSRGLIRLGLTAFICACILLLIFSFRMHSQALSKAEWLLRATGVSSDPGDRGGNFFTSKLNLVTQRIADTVGVSRTLVRPSDAAANTSNVDSLTFTISEPYICDELRPDIFTLIYIHSAPAHFKHRAIIRRTYGHANLYRKLRTVTVFFVGKSGDADVEQAVQLESERYHDIIQADFVDSYRNLSLKAVSALEWITRFCGRAQYALKADDDMFVNVFNLIRHLNYLRKYQLDEQRIHCLVWNKMGVIRDKKSKWFVTREEYKDDHFPTYCSGSAFFYRFPVAPALYNASKTAPFLWVDDVYATGILTDMAGVKHNSISSIVVLSSAEYDSKLIQGEAVFGHMGGNGGVDLRYQYWQKVLLKEKWAVS